MRKWQTGIKKDHKGFSLIELICAIAIFSIIITGVGSAMVISARSYANGNVELDLQQQAQITANLLTNLILDSNKVEVSEDGKVLRVEKVEADSTITVYEVSLSGEELVYRTGSSSGILAEHVTLFSASQAAGDNVDFQLGFKEGDRSYESDYHVTPRNGITSDGARMSETVGLYVENRLILEPRQTYDLSVRVTGVGTSDQGFSVVQPTDATSPDTKVTVNGTSVQITLGANELGSGLTSSFHFQVIANAVNKTVNEDGSTTDTHPTQLVEVQVRRVNTISLNGFQTDNMTYKVVANINGANLAKEPGSWWDVDYINPCVVRWAYTPNDALFRVNFVDDPVQPYAVVTLKRALQRGDKISLDAYAVHPEGEYPAGIWQNKASAGAGARTPYDSDVKDTWTLEKRGGWGRHGTLNFGLDENADDFLTQDTLWDGSLGAPYFDMGNCYMKLTYKAISASGSIIDEQQTGLYYGQGTGQGGFLSVTDKMDWASVVSGYQNWTLELNPHDTDHVSEHDRYMSYSSPYLELPGGHTVPDNPYTATNPVDTGRNLWEYNTNNFGYWKDAVKYVFVKETKDKYGNIATTETEVEVEDVSILYKNTSNAGEAWKRDNHVFVTKADSIEDYKVYFSFDRGWSDEDTNYYFDNLDRFVGVIYDDPDDFNELRYDLPVSQSDKTEAVNYLVFKLNSTTKNNAYNAARDHNGIIREIFEYNPYLGYLWRDPNNNDLILYPQAPGPMGPRATKEQMASIDGCEGTIIFHIVDPNIYGCDELNKPKVMYCPKQSEIGGSSLYYIDDFTRYHIASDTLAYYQVWEGGQWVNKLTFNWGIIDGAGREGWKKV